jgi:hypothetical protein
MANAPLDFNVHAFQRVGAAQLRAQAFVEGHAGEDVVLGIRQCHSDRRLRSFGLCMNGTRGARVLLGFGSWSVAGIAGQGGMIRTSCPSA